MLTYPTFFFSKCIQCIKFTFLDTWTTRAGKADSIVAALQNIIHTKGIPTHLISSLGTDGAALVIMLLCMVSYHT